MNPTHRPSTFRQAHRHSTPASAIARARALGLWLAIATLATACAGQDDVAPAPEPEPATAEVASEPTNAPVDEATDAAQADASGEAAATTDEAASAAPGPIDPAAIEMAEAEGVSIVEDWGAFPSADELEAAITRNLGVGDNAMALSIEAPSVAGPIQGAQVLELRYTIAEDAPHDFVGFNRDLDPPADWSGASGVALQVEDLDASGVSVVFQFREASGEVWRYEGPVPAPAASGAGGAPLVLAFSTNTFEWATWSTTENGEIDLGAIDQYGLYAGHTGPGRAGALQFGPLTVIR